MAILDDSVDFTVKLRSQIGEILSVGYPETVAAGETFDVTAQVKNNSTYTETFTLVLVDTDNDDNVLSRSSTRDFSAGTEAQVTCRTITMAATDMHVQLQLWRTV